MNCLHDAVSPKRQRGGNGTPRWRFGLTVFLLLGATARAEPPDLQVILQCEPHAMLTPAFRKHFREELGAGLRAALDGVGRAQVIDLQEVRPEDRLPAWTSAFTSGLERLERLNSSIPIKTHFLQLRFDAGQYEVASRGCDMALGWIAPATRRERTADRALLPRLMLGQVLHDYGITATIDVSDGDRSATLRLELGNASDARAADWVKLGDVFAVVQVAKQGECLRVPNVLLRVVAVPEGGNVACRVESRYVKPLAGWEQGGYRAVKLGTTRGPVRIRVVGPDNRPVEPTNVRVTAGSDRADPIREQGTTQQGRFASAESYDRIAFVRLTAGDKVLAQTPVEILGDGVVRLEVRGDATGDATALVDVDVRIVRGRILDFLGRLSEENNKLTLLLREGKNAPALAMVKATLARLDDEFPIIAGNAAALKSRIAAPAAEELGRFVKEVRDRQQTLLKLKPELEAAIGAANAPETVRKKEALRGLIARAEREIDEADYDRAILTYDEVVRQSGESPEPAKRLAELKAAWAIKSDAHRTARRFVYEQWATATTADEIAARIDGTRAAFAALKVESDRMTSRKIALGLIRAASILARREEELVKSGGDTTSLRTAAAAVKSLLDEVELYVKK